MSAGGYRLKFQVGARTLLSITRRMKRTGLSLDDVLAGEPPVLPPLGPHDHGHVVTSLPEALLPAVVAGAAGLRPQVRQRYVRRYADLGMGFDAYLATFSSKGRSTLLRKLRRFADRSGGGIDILFCRSAAELPEFFRLARIVSERSYQERLLDAGLPSTPADYAEMERLAEAGRLRAFILRLDGQPISYLYLPATGQTLIYAYLGFDPAHADLSPGAVLQLEAMRMLMEEGAFSRLDFTEGEGQHKRQFGTHGVPCLDLMLLRPSIGNRAAFGSLALFDRAVEAARHFGDAPLLRPLARAIRR